MKAVLMGALLLVLTGCGRMLPGAMYDLRDGTQLDFAIETSRGVGSMTAYNPQTGETFTGQYSGLFHGGGTALAHSAAGNVLAVAPPTGANARGILRGDQGTVIGVYLDIRPGFRPVGNGTAQDNKGGRYQVHF
jgi:hypothetical protein